MEVPPIHVRRICNLAEVIKGLFSTYNDDYEAGGREILSERDRRRVERGRIYTGSIGSSGVYMKPEPEAFVLSKENSSSERRKDIYSRSGAIVLHTHPMPGEEPGELVCKGLTIECTPQDDDLADIIAGMWRGFCPDGPVRIVYKNGY